VSLADFIAMGGYGFYVWGAYLTTAVLVVIEVAAVRARLRAARHVADGSREAR
jgi:heme exporter protein D